MTIAESNLPHEIKVKLSWLQGVCCAVDPDEPKLAYGCMRIDSICQYLEGRDYASAGITLNWLAGYLIATCPAYMVGQVQDVIGELLREIAGNNKDPDDIERLKQAIRAGSVEWESLKGEEQKLTNRKIPTVGEAGDCSDGPRVIWDRKVLGLPVPYVGARSNCSYCGEAAVYILEGYWAHERDLKPPEAESDNETKAQINFREFL